MKKSYLISNICLLMFSVALATVCCGQLNSNIDSKKTISIAVSKADKIEELVSRYAEYGKFNGTILVAEEGEILYKKGFGMANREWDIPNQTDTKFRLASVSKQFTAMLIVQLYAEGKLALDVPISNYLPDYPKENGDKITIHHLLSHTSGIPNFTSFPTYRKMMPNPITPTELAHTFEDSSLLFTPGSKYNYSNSGYVLLGLILEKISGKKYEQVLQEKILKPLKMNNTGIENRSTLLKNRATGYNKNVNTYENATYIDMSVGFSAGALYSTVEDLFLWDQALYTSTLLPSKYRDLVFEKHIPAWGQHYGYGWLIGEMFVGNTQEKVETINHDGVINGFSSLILRIPATRSSILILNNTIGAPLYEVSKGIMGILHDKSYDFPKKSLAFYLLENIDKEGLTKGIARYRAAKEEPIYNLDEHEMNRVSYRLLESDRKNAAIDVLKLGIEAYPNAFNLYDSYGEILRALGKKEEAIKKYKKSVSLNPENENGLRMLKELGVEINPEDLYLLQSGKTWGKEMFTFPLNFAPDLPYEGTEEAHFPRGWRKLESPEFWSYTFAWNINRDTEFSVATWENNLQIYFDGIMDAVNKQKDLVLPKSIAKLRKKGSVQGVPTFSGTIKVHDSFVTEKEMTLFTRVEQHYCEQKKRSILVFKFSPKAFGHEIWQVLDKIKLRDNACED